MGNDDPNQLLALLDDIDWDSHPRPSVHPLPEGYVAAQLAELANVTLGTAQDEERYFDAPGNGGSPIRLYVNFPLQSVEIITRLLPHARGAGGDWLVQDYATVVQEMLGQYSAPDSVVDAVRKLTLERRSVFDAAAINSARRLEDLVSAAILLEATEWQRDLARVARAAGADNVANFVDEPSVLATAHLGGWPGHDVARSREAMFTSGRAVVPFDTRALEAICVTWRLGRWRYCAFMFEDNTIDVARADKYTRCYWKLRSDRAGFATARSELLSALGQAHPVKRPRPPRWRRVVVRAWIDGELRELRVSRAQRVSSAQDARTWQELLRLIEPRRW